MGLSPAEGCSSSTESSRGRSPSGEPCSPAWTLKAVQATCAPSRGQWCTRASRCDQRPVSSPVQDSKRRNTEFLETVGSASRGDRAPGSRFPMQVMGIARRNKGHWRPLEVLRSECRRLHVVGPETSSLLRGEALPYLVLLSDEGTSKWLFLQLARTTSFACRLCAGCAARGARSTAPVRPQAVRSKASSAKSSVL